MRVHFKEGIQEISKILRRLLIKEGSGVGLEGLTDLKFLEGPR